MNKLKLIINIFITLALVVSYQNCAPSWQAMQGDSIIGSSTLDGSDDFSNNDGQFPVYSKFISTPNFRLLSNREIYLSLKTIIGQELNSFDKLPSSSYDPFDNDAEVLSPSVSLTEFIHNFSLEFSEEFTNSSTLMNKFFPCPSNDFSECSAQFIKRMGLLFFRRPISSTEFNDYQNLINQLNSSLEIKKTAQIILQAMVQDPNFLYKWEVGNNNTISQNSVTFYNLNNYEYISRLSYFLTGSGPDEATLTAIGNGALTSEANVLNYISQVQTSDAYKNNMMNFFGYWLGFAGLSNNSDKNSIEYNMFQESSALVYASIFQGTQDWSQVFKSKKTYVNKALANSYGFNFAEGQKEFSWVNYPSEDQMGYLAHLSFLSDWAKRGDTSTTQRGYHIFKRLFCGQKLPVPPGVDVDIEPGADINSPCKIEKVKGSLLEAGTSCVGCHSNMDTIAFGLENYGLDGKYRAAQPGEPTCTIDGEGYVKALGKSFKGISGLVDLGFSSESFQSCFAEHLIEYGVGQTLYNNQLAVISKTVALQRETMNFSELIKNILISNEFKYSTRGL